MILKKFLVPTILLLALYQFVQWWGFSAVLALIAAVLITISSLLIVFQEKLLYIPVVMGYRTVLDNPVGYRCPSEHGFTHTDFYVQTPDGQTIHGWHIRSPTPAAGTVLFCHENAGNIGLRVTNLVLMSQELSCDVVAFDYRGYGNSTGFPSEPGLIMDTDSVFSLYVAPNTFLPIYVYGRSLGGAVAIQWAASRQPPIAALIVENTFTSIADMVGSVFPFLNFALVKKHLLRLKWDTATWVRGLHVPMLLLAGEKDEIVPFAHMKRLDAVCPSPHEFVTFPNGTHNDTWVVGGKRYWDTIRQFVKKS